MKKKKQTFSSFTMQTRKLKKKTLLLFDNSAKKKVEFVKM